MELSLADFVLWVLVGSFALVGLCAMSSRYFHARAERRGLARRVICRLCLHAFEDSSLGPTVECPACRAVTEKGRGRSLG
ncbi:MAG: hypothetical protein NTW21_36140 [Verrucomicrobia bacterium]|nr:hypothetical protein [Verrucomicrobiota bacterium]